MAERADLEKATRRQRARRRKRRLAHANRPPAHPPDEHPPPTSHADEAVLIAVVVLLLAGLAYRDLSARLIGTLAKAGVAAGAAAAVLGLIGVAGVTFGGAGRDGAVPSPLPAGPAESTMVRSSVGRRARYILAAARRLQRGGSPTAERALFRAHLAAEGKRREAARAIDDAAAAHGPTLGWYSRRDGTTTQDCWDAHGGNFSALRPPSIGWPGTLHGGNCRCDAGPPWPEGSMLA